MTRALHPAVLLAVLLASGCGDDDEGGNPRIDSLAPAQATVGSTIDVLGVRFCGPAATDAKEDDSCAALPSGFVTFGTAPGVPAGDAGTDDVTRGQVVSWKGTRIQVKVPASLTPGVTRVVVTVNGLASNQHDFTVVAP